MYCRWDGESSELNGFEIEPPYHYELNPIEMVRADIKKSETIITKNYILKIPKRGEASELSVTLTPVVSSRSYDLVYIKSTFKINRV